MRRRAGQSRTAGSAGCRRRSSGPGPVLVAALCLAAACGRTATVPAWTLDLPDSAVVTATTVRLADIARGAVPSGPGAVVVASGGRPGASVEVTGRAVLRRLAMAGLAEGVALTGAERCRIVFAGGAVPAEELRRRLTDLLRPHLPPADPEAPPSWLELDLPPVAIDVGESWTLAWPRPQPLTPGRNLLTVLVTSGGTQQRLALAVVLHAYARVASPVRTIPRGQTADPEALRWQWVDLALTAAEPVTDPQALGGMQLARDLPAGEILQRRDLAPRPLVRRGEMIDLVLRRGGIAAVLRAECRQDGLLGQTISVLNPLTKRLVAARVTAPGAATIGR